MALADLHVHTRASDGACTPSEVVFMARQIGLAALGIADHDTMDGVDEATRAGREAGVEVVPGVEINTEQDGVEVHVLGYYPDRHHPQFARLLKQLTEGRRERLDRTVRRLEELGLHITAESVLQIAGDAAPGRPHVARALQQAGLVRDIREAFDLYLGIGKPAYVERYRLSPCEAVKAITNAGGVPVLAHPGLTGRLSLIGEMCACGLRGVEVYHPDHDEATIALILREANERGLIVTGGSDFHSAAHEHSGELGQTVVPYSAVLQLKASRK